jgi:hypothetical protein
VMAPGEYSYKHIASDAEIRALEKSWGFGLQVWREARLPEPMYRFRIWPVEPHDGNVHIYDIPEERYIGGFVWGRMLEWRIEQALAPYWHYEEVE